LEIFHEAEALSYTTSDSVSEFSETAASAGKADKLNANAVSDYVTYTAAVSQPGTYAVSVRYKAFPARGTFQLAVDGTNVGPVTDQYSSTTLWKESSLGNVVISAAGNHTFRFTVTGKHASSSGYDLTFDWIKLVK
jgi:hypothetical protein